MKETNHYEFFYVSSFFLFLAKIGCTLLYETNRNHIVTAELACFPRF